MDNRKGILLRINSQGELESPAISKENGEMVIQSYKWEFALSYFTILDRVNDIVDTNLSCLKETKNIK